MEQVAERKKRAEERQAQRGSRGGAAEAGLLQNLPHSLGRRGWVAQGSSATKPGTRTTRPGTRTTTPGTRTTRPGTRTTRPVTRTITPGTRTTRPGTRTTRPGTRINRLGFLSAKPSLRRPPQGRGKGVNSRFHASQRQGKGCKLQMLRLTKAGERM